MRLGGQQEHGGGKADLLILSCSLLEFREDTVTGPLQGMVPPLAGRGHIPHPTHHLSTCQQHLTQHPLWKQHGHYLL